MCLNRELSDQLASKMYVDPGDDDFGECFFNARRSLFRLDRLGQLDGEARYAEGYTVFLSYRIGPEPLHAISLHGWVEMGRKVVDTTYASYGRYHAAYFPVLHFTVDEIYQRLKVGLPHGYRSAFGSVFTTKGISRGYLNAWEYVIDNFPQEVTSDELDHVNELRKRLTTISDN